MYGDRELTSSFLRHIAVLLSTLDYQDVSKHGSKAANAYRLARKELRKINEKRNLLSQTSPSCNSRKDKTTVSVNTDNSKRNKRCDNR